MLFFYQYVFTETDIVICFKKVLQDPNVNVIMEQIKLQCLCSVELEETSSFRCEVELAKQKLNLGNFCIKMLTLSK